MRIETYSCQRDLMFQANDFRVGDQYLWREFWEVKGMFPVRLGGVGQLCVPFVCRSSSGSMGDGDRTSRLTVG